MALRQYPIAQQDGSEFGSARLVLGPAYEQKGLIEEAIAEFETASTLANGGSIFAASLAHAFGIAGRGAEALKGA